MQLVLLIGLQGSGKTSFYRAHFAATHRHVSKDNFRNNRNPGRRQAQLIEEALAAGQSVVVDNTNPRAADRAPVIALARRHDAEVVGYFFESCVPDCLERNRGRTGKARVPDVAVYATAKKLEPPTPAEGFDRLDHVCLREAGAFDVHPWPGPARPSPPTPTGP